MRRLLTLALGVAIGYVLGTRAGRDRYEQMADAVARLLHRGERREPSPYAPAAASPAAATASSPDVTIG